MKSELKSDVVACVYPCLKKHNEGAVVLFTESKMGLCVRAGRSAKLGEFKKDWTESNFVMLPENEKIALSN